MKSSARRAIKSLLFTVLGLMLLNLSAIPLGFGLSTQLQVVAPTTPILVTTQFDVDIGVVNVTDLYAWQIKLYYNPAVLRWINGTYPVGHVFEGKLFVSVPPFNGTDVDGTYVLFTASLQGVQPGINGSGVLCRISFEAKAIGSSTLIFSRPLGPDPEASTWLTKFDLNYDIPFTVIERGASNPVTVSLDSDLPVTSDDYEGSWHTADFYINLTASDNTSGVAETFYRINQGTIETVKTDGQPRIVTESANNTLEYWSVDNAGNEEIPHHLLKEIKLDKTGPEGSFTINSGATYANDTSVGLRLLATDATSGVFQMRLSNDNITYANWRLPNYFIPWFLQEGEGAKTVYLQLIDNAGVISSYSQTIILDTTPPVISIISPYNNARIGSSAVTVTWEGSDSISGIDHYEVRLDSGDWVSVEMDTVHIFTGLGDGAHSVAVKALNRAGSERVFNVSFNVNTGPFLGLGLLQVIGLLAAIILIIVGVCIYIFRIRKH